MGNINDHANPFHFLYKGNARFCQAMLRIRHRSGWRNTLVLPIWEPKFIGKIPGNGHHPGTQAVKITQAGQIPFANPALFQSQHSRHFSGLLVFFYIFPAFYDSNAVRIRF